MNLLESTRAFEGTLRRYQHDSETTHCSMVFSLYLPPKAHQQKQKVPVLYWLSGLTCSDENARTKAGILQYAAQYGLAIIFPDTSPRGENVPDEVDRYDLGQGAGFYLNATTSPWNQHYQMYDYIVKELPTLIADFFPILTEKKSIFGHSMGGHGALICALRNPQQYQSVSAFAPICHPLKSPWGQTCFKTYLGENKADWNAYDATDLVSKGAKLIHILIDQGDADEFYRDGQLLTEDFQQACQKAKQPLELRIQAGYDHSYYFISTFIGDHLAYHAKALKTHD